VNDRLSHFLSFGEEGNRTNQSVVLILLQLPRLPPTNQNSTFRVKIMALESSSHMTNSTTSVQEFVSRIQRKIAQDAGVLTQQSSPKAYKVQISFVGSPIFSGYEREIDMVIKGTDSPSTVSSTSFSSFDGFLPSLSSDEFGCWVESEQGNTSPRLSNESERMPSEYVRRQICLIQSMVRRFLCQKHFQRKQTLAAMDTTKRRQFAAIQIQAVFRGWYSRMTQRIVMLEKRLLRSQRKKERTLQWIEARKKNEMEEIQQTTAIMEESRKSQITKSQRIIDKLRAENKQIRCENEVIKEDIATELDRFTKQQKLYVTGCSSILTLQEHLPSLEAENKAATDATAILESYVADLTESLEIWDENVAYEKRVRQMTQTLAQSIKKEVEKSSEDQELVEEICTSICEMLKINATLKKKMKREARKSVKKTRPRGNGKAGKRAVEKRSKIVHKKACDRKSKSYEGKEKKTASDSKWIGRDMEKTRIYRITDI
jgi:hypothetical protein